MYKYYSTLLRASGKTAIHAGPGLPSGRRRAKSSRARRCCHFLIPLVRHDWIIMLSLDGAGRRDEGNEGVEGMGKASEGGKPKSSHFDLPADF